MESNGTKYVEALSRLLHGLDREPRETPYSDHARERSAGGPRPSSTGLLACFEPPAPAPPPASIPPAIDELAMAGMILVEDQRTGAWSRARDGGALDAEWARFARQIGARDAPILSMLVRAAPNGGAFVSDVRAFVRKRGTARRDTVVNRSRRASGGDWRRLEDALAAAPRRDAARLLYAYWHEEAGLFWAVERLADRFENGVHEDTTPLRGVDVEPSVTAGRLLSNYLALRRRGTLSTLDERWTRYLARYGFAPHIASAWPPIEGVEIRTRFADAFHGWLGEVLWYQRSVERQSVEPDAAPAQEATRELLRQMDERDAPCGASVRPELGLLKLILEQPYLRDRLGVRRGVTGGLRSWEQSLDAIATAYRWTRASTEHYRELAECGELILLLVSLAARVVDEAGPFRALLAMVKELVTRYVSGYRTVTGIDLRVHVDRQPPHRALRGAPAPRVPPIWTAWLHHDHPTHAALAAPSR